MLRRARAMVPRLAERAAKAEAARRIPDETIAELQEAGLIRILQPKRWDGYEMEPGIFYDVLMTLAEGCMSTAWVYGVLGVHPWLMGILDDRAAQEVWGKDRSVLMSSSLMPTGKAVPVEGGFRFSGRWQYSSGCEHCTWVLLGGAINADPSIPANRCIFLLPRKDYEIIDTWHVAGLKATGSHDIVVKDAFVPDYRMNRMVENFECRGPGQALNPSPLYRLPMGQIFFHGVATGAIGALQGMLDAALKQGAARVSFSGVKTASDPVAQLACAEAAASIDEMKITMHRNWRNLASYAERSEKPPLAERVHYKFQSAWAVERCAQLAVRIFKISGAGAVYADRPFGRFLADINAARQHISNQSDYYGRVYGAMLLGGPGPPDLNV
jgi:3-hydroxy-9,10-secoandrosta-1,3,5(10)-triene-9,17-dione monooxygenase